MKQSGFSLIEALVAAGLLGGAALGLTEFFSKSNNQINMLEQRYTRMDTEQAVRSILSRPDFCTCNFKHVAFAPSATPLTNINNISVYPIGSGCDTSTAQNLVKSNQVISGTPMKVGNIELINFKYPSPTMVMGDLKINYAGGGTKSNIKPSIITNMTFNMKTKPDGTWDGLSSCSAPTGNTNIYNTNITEVKGCGEGKICFNGKEVTFMNKHGQAVTTLVNSIDEDGMTLFFQTPTGRTLLLKFKEANGQLVPEIPSPNWRYQFCYKHANSTPCAVQNTWGIAETNCGSSLYWTGSYSGNTEGQSTACY